jgi:acyl transferase domain-containing protein
MRGKYGVAASDIAIVGMACRFPGANTADDFWRNLRDGRETATFFTDEELRAAGVEAALLGNPRYVKAGQILADAELFDAQLFNIPAEDAEILDPQQRHFLECALEALENAGYNPGAFPGLIGVYAGAGMNTYILQNLCERYRASSPLDRYRLMLANDKDYLATRASYKLNLRGPSVSINTACSTSLVAVHFACLGLLRGDCDMALAGAVHIACPPKQGYLFQEGLIFSPDGHCRAFDAKARGTIIGSGVGIVVLKRLQEAIADGDWIYAVIKGSAVNNDGAAKAGYTAPSEDGQAAVIAAAQAAAGCNADTISYVEAHGTGTPTGDPVELAGLRQVFSSSRESSCALGSVKTNIGHLDAAAGMAGLIKTSLMLQHKQLVPSLHFEAPHPEVDFANGPFRVSTKLEDWMAGPTRRRAGVSSFGIGGTNAHVVLEEAPEREPAAATGAPQLLVISARSAQALEKATANLARHLNAHPELDLADVAYTLAVGRRAYAYRRALVCRTLREAALTLALVDDDRVATGQGESDDLDVAFVFAGQVGKRGAAGAQLYRELPLFRDAVDRCLAACGWAGAVDAASLLEAGGAIGTVVAQYALSDLWMSWGVKPAGLVAVGPGELVAACRAGVLQVERALAVAKCHDAGEPIPELALPAPQVALLSNSTGHWMKTHVTIRPGQWTEPHKTPPDLSAHAVRALAASRRVPLEIRLSDGLEALLHEVSRVWIRGAAIDWRAFFAGDRRRRVPLPTYPFDHKRYWVEPERPAPAENGQHDIRQNARTAGDADKLSSIFDLIRNEIVKALGPIQAERFALDKNLFEMGLDSLILISLAAKLSETLQCQVPPSWFVEYPTVRAFAENLAAALGLSDKSSARPEDRRHSRRAGLRRPGVGLGLQGDDVRGPES